MYSLGSRWFASALEKQRISLTAEIANAGLLWINKTHNIALYVTSSNAVDQEVLKGVDRDRERFSHW